MSSDKRQFDILDFINIISFYIGIQNLDENLSQGKAGDMLEKAVKDIHDHLKDQDAKIDKIMEMIENDKNKKIN